MFAFFVALLHLAEHFIGNFFRDGRPDFDDLVVALAVGDRAVQILLLDVDDLLFGVVTRIFLLSGNDHVIDADGEAGASGVAEAKLLDFVEHLDRGFQAKAQVAVVHQLRRCPSS